MMSAKLFSLLLMVIASVCTASFVEDISPRREAKARLYDDLAANRILNTKISPLSQEDVVNVDFYMLINQVSEVVEAKQTMTAHVYLEMVWEDRNLAWREEDYDNISYVTIPSHLLWRPTIYQSSSSDQHRDSFNEPSHIILHSNGTLMTSLADFVTTHCNFDLTYYPLDTQTCAVTLAYQGLDVDVKARNVALAFSDPEVIATFFGYNGEWQIEKRSVHSPERLNNGFGVLKISVTIRRATLYYILCVLLPMITTSMLTLLVFWIPPASGEKMSYLVSIYVSTALFLNFVGDTLPRNMSRTNIPRMTLFLIFVIMECMLALAATVLVMRTRQQEQEILNQPLMKGSDGDVVEDLTEPQASSKSPKKGVDSGQPCTGSGCCIVLTKLARLITCSLAKIQSTGGNSLSKRKKSVAARLDMIFFWIFFITCVLFYTLIFLI